MSADLQLLKDVVREAGARAIALREAGLSIEHKPGGSPVTNADHDIDAFLKERLRAARPDYGWLSEETPDNPERLAKSTLFLCDPIDGTSAFMKGKEAWSICAAVVANGRPVAGVVFAPSVNEFYEAEAGEGARLNGAPIRVTDRVQLEGCAMLGDAKMFAHPAWPEQWPPMHIETRNSIAYRMALVAAGRFDAVLAPSPKHDWDLAAGDLIVTEAGGLVTDHKGRSFVYNRPNPQQRALVCSGAGLHSLLLQRLVHMQD
jgi:myo-inositol-1(or 4)-monophosphatase